MFQRQKEAVERKISSLQSVRNMIRMRIKLIEEGLERGEEIRIVDQEPVPLYVSDGFHYDTNEIPDDIWIRFYDSCEEKEISFCYPVCYIVRKDDLLDHCCNMVSNLCFRMESDEKANHYMPKGTYLVGYGYFHYGDTSKLYEKLYQYAMEHQMEICGDAYEEYLLDEVTTSHADAYKVKLSIQIV